MGIKLAVIRGHGFAITEAQLALFHALDDAARLTDLAAAANVGKAAMVELIDRAVAAGLVERRTDPSDRRGRIVVATAPGRALRTALTAGIAAAEDDAIVVLGAGAATALKRTLADYIAAPGARCALLPPSAGIEWAATNIGRATGLANRRFVADVAAAVAQAGFDVTPALLGMIRQLDIDGCRLTTLAARARMTKPAMTELVARAVRLDYVTIETDDTDRRARLIIFAARGRDLLAAAGQGIAGAEAAMAARAGEDYSHTVEHLAKLAGTSPPRNATDAARLSSEAICHRSAATRAA